MPPVASPIDGEDLDSNIYHAHVVLPEEGDSDAPYRNALHLRFLFAKYGSVHVPAQSPPVSNDRDAGTWRTRMSQQAIAIYRRLVQWFRGTTD
jgi:hypothetical protein